MTTLSPSPTNPVDGPVLAFGKHLPALEQLDDAAFLARVLWKPGAPRALKNIISAENGSDGWADRLYAAAGAKSRPNVERALWSREAFESPPRIELLAEALNSVATAASGTSRKAEKRAAAHAWGLTREWIAEHAVSPTAEPVELLFVLELLAMPPAAGEAATYLSLWRTGLTSALLLTAALNEPEGAQPEPDQRLLVLGELPWRLGLMFGGVKGAGSIRRRGAQALSAGLLEHTDTDGMPHAALMNRFPMWLAALVRSITAGRSFDARPWNDEAQQRFSSLVRQTSLLYHPQRRVALSNGHAGETLPLLHEASKLAGLRKQSPVRKYLRGLKKSPSIKAEKRKRQSLSARRSLAVQSDWAQLACSRNALSADCNSIVVAHHQHPPAVELTCRGNPVLQGGWDVALTLDGEAVPLEGDWSCVCWHTDRGADYLELQLKTDVGVRIDRQILLAWADDYAILADAISGAGQRRIDYQGSLPLAPQVEVTQQSETRELILRQQQTRVRAVPTCLPDDRGISTPGAFNRHEDRLQLKHVSSAGGLYASLVLDWSPARRREQAQWRQLTVSEGGRVLAPGRAVGHRVMIGKLHLLIYRSLDEAEESRTVLGHHTLHETVIGGFTKGGEINPILLVE